MRNRLVAIVLLALVAAAAAVPLAGCVRRTLTVTSDPPGALVYLNGQEFGRTPVTREFTWYGVYDVRIRKDGYETLAARGEVIAPWWQWVPFDLAAELLPLTDRQSLSYRLAPTTQQVATDPQAMLDRAAAMRGELRSGRLTRTPTTIPATTAPGCATGARVAAQPARIEPVAHRARPAPAPRTALSDPGEGRALRQAGFPARTPPYIPPTSLGRGAQPLARPNVARRALRSRLPRVSTRRVADPASRGGLGSFATNNPPTISLGPRPARSHKKRPNETRRATAMHGGSPHDAPARSAGSRMTQHGSSPRDTSRAPRCAGPSHDPTPDRKLITPRPGRGTACEQNANIRAGRVNRNLRRDAPIGAIRGTE